MKYLIILLTYLTLLGCNGSSDSDKHSSDTELNSTNEILEDLAFPQSIAKTSVGVLRPSQSTTVYNAEAVIPPQCYTKHEGHYNPCMTCHQSYDYRSRPNTMNDGGQQSEYAFSDIGETNHWQNLFEDRTDRIANISDQQVIDYIYSDNYTPLIEQIKNTADWQGPIPEIENLHLGAEAFDEQGFAKDGSGWVAFSYKPLPSTFWPTNGSTDDVMIRLPAKFRTSACLSNIDSRDTYLANLSILEMAIKDLAEISVPEIDENAFCEDLNGDNQLTVVSQINKPSHYVGAAEDETVNKMLYPLGTEFLHSVRYVGVDEIGNITVPPHMKELRYMNKFAYFTPEELASKYSNEAQEKIDELLPAYINRGDKGTDNSFGWMVLGFIENNNGSLRIQSEEENLFCMGCHTTIGTTIDQTFAFPRKVTGAKGWSYIDLKGMPDAPYLGSEHNLGEIAHYLQTVGGGNEFRENDEIRGKYLNADGSLNLESIEGKDVYELITPSLRRALDLNKAYMTIVSDQDFIHGRDANIKPAKNVYRKIDDDAPVLPDDKTKSWDIRLNWE